MTDDLISRQALIAEIMRRGIYPPGVRHAIENAPAIDAVPVVRCKDCIKWEADGTYEFDVDGTKILWGACSNSLHHCKYNHFCSHGERKEAE